MNREERHAIHLAIVELNWYSTLAHALNTEVPKPINWKQAKKEFAVRGCQIVDDTEENEETHKQVDCFGTFANFTLGWDKESGYFIGFGWVLDDWNTDLYAHRVGDFRPYYNNHTKRCWLRRIRGELI